MTLVRLAETVMRLQVLAVPPKAAKRTAAALDAGGELELRIRMSAKWAPCVQMVLREGDLVLDMGQPESWRK